MPLPTLTALWNYRGFLAASVARDFTARYRNSLLGGAWGLLHPLAMIVVYTLVFSHVMQARLPGQTSTDSYSIFLCAGLLPWGLFVDIATRSQSMFIDHANLLKKVNFPRACLPVMVLANAILQFIIPFILFLVYLALIGQLPGWPLLAMLPLLLLLALFALGLGLILGVFNVFFRDIGNLFTIAITFWFWLSPIIYPPAVLPEQLREWIALNPMTGFLAACRSVFLEDRWPDWTPLWPMLTAALVLCLLGASIFRRSAADIVDEL